MSMMGSEPPRTPGGRMGGMDEERLLQEAERERLAHETDEIHREETEEAGEPPAPAKPWWKFWG